MRNLQPNYEKRSVGKGHLFERVIWPHESEEAPCGCPLNLGARGFAHPEPIGVTPLWDIDIETKGLKTKQFWLVNSIS